MVGGLMSMTPGSATEIAHRLERLRSPIRVLYVAAHPDDENTQFLTWLARGYKVRAGYLSLTRGDGGQNLIGAEQRPLLGVIRTHELLAARELDGAEQWFTRLRDFGYSKSAEETFRTWGEDFSLSEVTRVFRTFRPHVVVTRFPEEGPTHGHHLASARLARRAFMAASDPHQFPDQIKEGLRPWKVRRLFYNFPHFWASRGREPPPGKRFDIDVGGYDSWLGVSYGEISGRSRSMHKSQGFGASARVGPWMETLIQLEGDEPKGADPWAGLPGWQDLPGGAEFGSAIQNVLKVLDGRHPAALLPWLGTAHKAAGELKDEVLRGEVQQEIERLLVAASGLYVEARADVAEVFAGRTLSIKVRALARAEGANVVLRRVSGNGFSKTPRIVLSDNKVYSEDVLLKSENGSQPSRPHWLSLKPAAEKYTVSDAQQALKPVAPYPFEAAFEVGIGGVGLVTRVPVLRHWVDPVLGERTEPLDVAPPVSVTPEAPVVVVPKRQGQELRVTVRAGLDGFKGHIGWTGTEVISPARLPVDLPPEGTVQLSFKVSGSLGARSAVRSTYQFKGEKPRAAWTRVVVDHTHIPRVTHRAPAAVELVPAELELPKGRFGYIPGSGDAVASILGRLGLHFADIDERMLTTGELAPYDAILVGIRAFNVNEALVRSRDRLMDYVHKGGTLVVQYNTKNFSSKLGLDIGPYPISISRGRVTDETAEVRMLDPAHILLKRPHRLTMADFSGWVQERGLYFAESWDAAYTPIFSMNDMGEEPLTGSTLYARYGKGHYVFTGLSFFRQLPSGNPGAIRLLINFLSVGLSAKDSP